MYINIYIYIYTNANVKDENDKLYKLYKGTQWPTSIIMLKY